MTVTGTQNPNTAQTVKHVLLTTGVILKCGSMLSEEQGFDANGSQARVRMGLCPD